MRSWVWLSLLCGFVGTAVVVAVPQTPTISLSPGILIDRSVTVRPGHVALVAEGTANLPTGDYTLTVISDDGARVWVDGEEVIDAWSPHESKVARAAIRGGRRTFKVEYYEIDGFAELRFDIQRR